MVTRHVAQRHSLRRRGARGRKRREKRLTAEPQRRRDLSRVALGGCPPRAPTDPDVRNSRIRLFEAEVRYARCI